MYYLCDNVSVLLFYDSFQKRKTNCRCRSGGFNLQIVFRRSIKKDFSGSREFFVRQPQIELYRNVGQKGKQKGQIGFFMQFCSTQLSSGFPDCLRVMQTNPADNTVIIPVKACTLCQAAGVKFAQGKEFSDERSSFYDSPSCKNSCKPARMNQSMVCCTLCQSRQLF